MRVGKAVGLVLVGLVDGLTVPIALLTAYGAFVIPSPRIELSIPPTVVLGVALAVYPLAVVLAVALSFRSDEAFPLAQSILAAFRRMPMYIRGMIWT
jgi:hypothetical protein